MECKRKRYKLFGFYDYYPGGGRGDDQGSYDSFEDIRKAMIELHYENYEVLDMDSGEWIDIDV